MKMHYSDEYFARTLIHEYDPVKRHQYYERTKKLKGRGSGLSDPSPTTDSSGQRKASGGVFNKPKDIKTAEQRKAEIETRVAAYKQRLDKLKKVLAELVAEAKKRSADNAGTKESRAKDKTKETSSEEKTGSKDSKDSDLSSKEKADARKRSKEYYDKNKDKISLKKQEERLVDEIKKVEEKISKIRDELKSSIKKARDKAALVSSK